jgi:hydroxyacylglutathione hydrolase
LVKIYTFNPFQENTYIIYDDSGEAVIIDPGCSNASERKWLSQGIKSLGVIPVRLINTHCHIDHILGNNFVANEYGLELEIHEGELPVLRSAEQVAEMFGIPYSDPSPLPGKFLKEGDEVVFGNTRLQILFTPGHSPASISLYCEKEKYLIAGDVLFKESIGRTDLPGGDFSTLISSIQNKLFVLPNEVVVYPGHGPETTIGHEKMYNPFLNQDN